MFTYIFLYALHQAFPFGSLYPKMGRMPDLWTIQHRCPPACMQRSLSWCNYSGSPDICETSYSLSTVIIRCLSTATFCAGPRPHIRVKAKMDHVMCNQENFPKSRPDYTWRNPIPVLALNYTALITHDMTCITAICRSPNSMREIEFPRAQWYYGITFASKWSSSTNKYIL